MDLKGAGNIYGLDSCHKVGTSKHENLRLYSIKDWEFLDQVSENTSQGQLFMWLSVCRNLNDCNIQKVQFCGLHILWTWMSDYHPCQLTDHSPSSMTLKMVICKFKTSASAYLQPPSPIKNVGEEEKRDIQENNSSSMTAFTPGRLHQISF